MAITTSEVKSVIINEDDFGHEMRVGSIFENVEYPEYAFDQVRVYSPLHGGTYTDRVTGKTRQFDYRCQISRENGAQNVYLAAECKNLNRDLPLVVCGRLRTSEESCHVVLQQRFDRPPRTSVVGCKKYEGFESIYKPNAFVGKSVLRLKKKGNDLCSDGDSEIYDKWSQAMSSCPELCEKAFDDMPKAPSDAFILPVVVLPNDTLWIAIYNQDGVLTEDPTKVDDCEFYIGQEMRASDIPPFRLTHVHFLTLNGLSKMLSRFVAPKTRVWQQIFGA